MKGERRLGAERTACAEERIQVRVSRTSLQVFPFAVRLWPFFLVGLLSVFCLLAPLPPAEAGLIGRSTEISMGREAAQEFEKSAVVDNDPAAVARIQRIGRRLVSVCDAPDYPFEFHYVDGEEVNAFALPGGYIYLYRGLLQLLPNDDALAFVMSHEIAHVTKRHGMDQIQKQMVASFALDALLGRGSASQILQSLLSLSYSRSDEREADDVGLRCMARAGFNPESGIAVMEILGRMGGDSVPKLLRTHPNPKDRREAARKQAEGLRKQQLAERAKQPAVPAPPVETPTIGGLADVSLCACDHYPLKPGMRWHYRVSGPHGSAKTTWTVLEELPMKPEGVYRVEADYGAGVKSVQLVAAAGDRLLKRSPMAAADEWQVDAAFDPSDAPDGFRVIGEETVQVPAGDFPALKVERVAPDGAVLATAWFAKGIGLVKRSNPKTGITEELESYQVPR